MSGWAILLTGNILFHDWLKIDGDQGLSAHGKPVLKFSQSFQKETESLQGKNYQLKSARVNFITYWKGADSEREIKIVLPKVVFEKNGELKGPLTCYFVKIKRFGPLPLCHTHRSTI